MRIDNADEVDKTGDDRVLIHFLGMLRDKYLRVRRISASAD